jgi:hypothetical protein
MFSYFQSRIVKTGLGEGLFYNATGKEYISVEERVLLLVMKEVLGSRPE